MQYLYKLFPYFSGFTKACDELKKYQENLAKLPDKEEDDDDDGSESSNEKEEVEFEPRKLTEETDPYDFDSEMAAETAQAESSDHEEEESDVEKKPKKRRRQEKREESVENGALEVSSTSSPQKKRPCLKVSLQVANKG